MLVNTKNFEDVIRLLKGRDTIAVDTETTGLFPYKNDRLFSIIVSIEGLNYYFNFYIYDKALMMGFDDYSKGLHTSRAWIKKMQPIFDDPDKFVIMHNAKFDMAFLEKEGLVIHRKVKDTKTRARILYNQHMSYSLANCAERIGLKKDDTVEKHIKEKKLFTLVKNKYKTAKTKLLHYDRVPFHMIRQYGEIDGMVTYELGTYQDICILKQARMDQDKPRTILDVAHNEMLLTRTVYDMEKVGVKVDVEYCLGAARKLNEEMKAVEQRFQDYTGHKFVDSSKTFKNVIDPELMPKTPTGAPSYAAKALEAIAHDNPVAAMILEQRGVKKTKEFMYSFLHFATVDNRVHASFNPEGTVTGRFSCSNPNLQQLTRDEEDDEFSVRRAVVADDGFVFANMDYQAQEMRLIYDLSGAKTIIDRIKGSEKADVHQITADLSGVTRQQAKAVNFGIIYGIGIVKLSKQINTSPEEAKKIKAAVLNAAPEVKKFITQVTMAAEKQGYVDNWLGRRYFFPDKDKAYIATNHVIQGGSSEIMKIALNDLHDYLQDKKSFLSLTVHDSAVVSVHESEMDIVDDMKQIMIDAYPHKSLPMDVDVKMSTSLASV